MLNTLLEEYIIRGVPKYADCANYIKSIDRTGQFVGLERQHVNCWYNHFCTWQRKNDDVARFVIPTPKSQVMGRLGSTTFAGGG